MKTWNATCDICTQYHNINFQTNSTYYESLSKVIKVTVIEALQGIEANSTEVNVTKGILRWTLPATSPVLTKSQPNQETKLE